jgi:hypothetical protein
MTADSPSALVLALTGAVLVLATAISGSSTVTAAQPAPNCPPSNAKFAPSTVEEAIRAAYRLIPAAYHAETPGNEWAKHPDIIGALELGHKQPELPGVATWRRLGARQCSRRVVLASWVIAVDFPGMKVAGLAPSVVFLIKTKSGWRLWYHYR